MARSRQGPSNTIVIKLGTSSIVHETTHQPLLSTLSAVVETVVHLRAQGHKVVLVSSGAIGVGLKRMDMAHRPKNLSGKQALAAIGQGRLIALWDNLFNRTRYLNAVNTFKELISMGVIPIVNENDTVSVSEIKFGDNDTLSAITASMIHADYLFLLTDVDALYTANPRKDPTARSIDVVSSISTIRSQVSTTTLGSSLGTGGMETKLIAAEIATAAGVTTVITSSKDPKNIFKIIEYNNALKSGTSTPAEPYSGRSSPSSSHVAINQVPEVSAKPPPNDVPRPPHTLFKPSPMPLRDLKSWTSHTLHPSGSVIIDSGAHRVLARRESGGRLLPAGVLGIRGAFASGQAVRILVRRRPLNANSEEPTFSERDHIDAPGTSEPNTPILFASASVTSSISTLDPGLDVAGHSLKTVDEDMTPSATLKLLPEDEPLVEHPREETDEWEVDEVGRGLANYNSAQIEKVKGLKSSYIPQLLEYADSEYMVENITIRVPP